MSKTLTITEVAKAAGVSRPTIYAWWNAGKIPVEPIEGSKPPRWNTLEICAWLKIAPETLGG